MVTTPQEVSRERHWVCARRIGERRRQLGLTQLDVVERLEALGVAATNRTQSAMEHGQGLDVGRLPDLAIALDCTTTYLLGLTADPRRWAPDDLSVEVTVDVTTSLEALADVEAPPAAPQAEGAASNEDGAAQARPSWILGPDVPDRHVTEPVSRRA